MDDMGDDFRAARKYYQNIRYQNLKEAQWLTKDFTCHTPFHYATWLNGDKLDWWPSTSKWRWRGKNYHGSAFNLAGFLGKRGWIGEK